ncbi:hypothetical protein ASG95_09805 [Phycicoccus sp. Soil803]|nr:hypothetical protein ASG95_09805 [Phycicoccus sp. Soil803]
MTPDGLRRIAMLRTQSSGMWLSGKATTRTETLHLDGTIMAMLDDGETKEDPVVIAYDAMPARTQDILDLARHSLATSLLARQIGEQAASGERPSAAQLKVWVDSYRGLVEWKREAERRMAQAQGQIDALGMLLGRFV